LVVVLLATACGPSSRSVATQPANSPRSSDTTGVNVGAAPTSIGASSTAPPPSALLPQSTNPPLPVRRQPGEPEIRCSVTKGLLGPKDAAPEASASELRPFSFPPATASAQDRPVSDADIAGFIAAFAALRSIPATIPVVVVPGSARVAYVPFNGQHWGLASFSLPPGVSIERRFIGSVFDPPQNMMAFVRPPGCPWSYKGQLAEPFPCPNAKDIPEAVQQVWRIPSPPKEACDNLGGQTR